MKNIEKLKAEQQELKERLLKLTDFINSEEYYQCDTSERNLLNQQRAGMEMYLNALTRRICGDNDLIGGSSFLLPMMMSMLTPSSGFGSIASTDRLKEAADNATVIDEEK